MLVVLFSLLIVGIAIYLLEFDLFLLAKLKKWRHAMQARKHRKEPIYERIAKAYEWKAELHLQEGRIEQARDEFRKAEETRSEAMEAMMNGQEPKL